MDKLVPSRRKFISSIAATTSLTGLATAGFAGIPEKLGFTGNQNSAEKIHDADEWFNKVKGTHRIVYDAPEPHMGFPVVWSWAFYMTNNQTGTSDEDMTSVVVLRHNAVPFALHDDIWKKYKFGEMFNITDNNTGAKAVRNNVYEPQGKDFPLPIVDGIRKQQDRGAMYCVCDLALNVYSGA
ncbi:MAG: Tat (twin-arginine translocation) pathway signal sequence containing protein, partial [Cyclobacteriaceae bacterium]